MLVDSCFVNFYYRMWTLLVHLSIFLAENSVFFFWNFKFQGFIVLKLLLIFHRKQDFCSYKIVLIKKECSRSELCLFIEQTHKKIIIFNAQPSCANEASVAYLSPCRKLWTTGDGIVLFLICKKLVLNGCSSLKTKHFDSIFSRMVEEIFIFDLNNGLGIFIQLFAWKYANTPLFSGWKQRVVHNKGTRVYFWQEIS